MFSNIYPGIVVDNKDPRDIGRVKVHVPGVYPDFDNDNEHLSKSLLPWATPMLSLYNSGGDNMKAFNREEDNFSGGYMFNKTGTAGIYTVPGMGSHVFVFFQQGNHMRPVYMGANPNESDWLTQKMLAKDRVFLKLKQISEFKDKFTPVGGEEGTDGDGWADGAHVNPRMRTEGNGEGVPYALESSDAPDDGLDNATDGETTIKVDDPQYGPYDVIKRAIDNSAFSGEGYERIDYTNPDNRIERASGNMVGLDVKPLLDEEEIEGDIDRSGFPHEYGEGFDPIAGTGEDAAEPQSYNLEDDKRHINRDITTMMTKGGTTIVVDNREGEENFYLIHKNYLFNVDELGSVKEFCGQNVPVDDQPREPTYNGETEDDELRDETDENIRANKELGVTGMYKIHVLGNFVTYTKGNAFMQVDRNMQIDVNDTYGLRVRKGDVDIVIEGEEDDDARDGEEGGDPVGVESGKTDQYGDLNVAVKNGNIEVYCKENANIHVGGQCNIRSEGDMKIHARKDFHLLVEGNYHEFVNGKRFSTTVGRADYRYKCNRRTFIEGHDRKRVGKKNHCIAGVDLSSDEQRTQDNPESHHIFNGNFHHYDGEIRVHNDLHLIGNMRCENSMRLLTLEVDGDVKIVGSVKADGSITSLEDVMACPTNSKGVKLAGHKHKVKKLRVKTHKVSRRKQRGRTKPGKTKKPKRVSLNCSPVELSDFLLPIEPDEETAPENPGAGTELPDNIYEFTEDGDNTEMRTPVRPEEESLIEEECSDGDSGGSANEIKVALRTHPLRVLKEDLTSAVPEEEGNE